MKKILFALVFIPGCLFAGTDPDAAIQASFPAAQPGVNYGLVKNPDGGVFISNWTVTKSTPILSDLLNAYAASAAKSTLDAGIVQLKTKLSLTDNDLQTLKAALK